MEFIDSSSVELEWQNWFNIFSDFLNVQVIWTSVLVCTRVLKNEQCTYFLKRRYYVWFTITAFSCKHVLYCVCDHFLVSYKYLNNFKINMLLHICISIRFDFVRFDMDAICNLNGIHQFNSRTQELLINNSVWIRTSVKCINYHDNFCYVCGQYIFSYNKKDCKFV